LEGLALVWLAGGHAMACEVDFAQRARRSRSAFPSFRCKGEKFRFRARAQHKIVIAA